MTEPIPALIDLIVQTSGQIRVTDEGDVITIPDNEFIKFRLLDIDSDNYAAFLKALMNLKALALTFDTELTPALAAPLKAEVMQHITGYVNSSTGKSSEHSKLIKEIIKDEQHMFHYFKESGGKKSFADRIPSFQGNDGGGGAEPEPQQGGSRY